MFGYSLQKQPRGCGAMISDSAGIYSIPPHNRLLWGRHRFQANRPACL